jgi:lipase chaperone LimK
MTRLGRIGLASASVVAALAVASWVVVNLLSESENASPIDESSSEFQPPDRVAETPAPEAAIREPVRNLAPTASVADVATGDVQQAAFRADAAGELVLDEQTRLNIEMLVAQTDANSLYAATREQTEDLPPAAARRAEELVERFVSYQQAQRQSYPPGAAPPTAEDAIRELEGLHALREAHFGVDVARRFYGAEEIVAREMIELMRVENDTSLTAQEKLERSNALRTHLTAVTAIERGNREAKPSPQ